MNKSKTTYSLNKRCRICGKRISDQTTGDTGQVCAAKEMKRQKLRGK